MAAVLQAVRFGGKKKPRSPTVYPFSILLHVPMYKLKYQYWQLLFISAKVGGSCLKDSNYVPIPLIFHNISQNISELSKEAL